jgi:hypothetical protein
MDDVIRLRQAERLPDAAGYVRPVRRRLESRLAPTLSRSLAARLLGVSQPALDRWVKAGRIPTVVTPRGRREVPRQFVIELRESIDELSRRRVRRPLAAALAARRAAAEGLELPPLGGGPPDSPRPHGHETAERRARALHALVAERLDEAMLEEAREEVERLAAAGQLHERYAQRWRNVLARSPAEVAVAMVADTQKGRDLRQNSPFAGVLNEQERRRVIERVR